MPHAKERKLRTFKGKEPQNIGSFTTVLEAEIVQRKDFLVCIIFDTLLKSNINYIRWTVRSLLPSFPGAKVNN